VAIIFDGTTYVSWGGFPLFNASFQGQQESCLQDYLETSIMLQYNNRVKIVCLFSIIFLVNY